MVPVVVRVVAMAALLAGCGKAQEREPAAAEPTEAELVARAAALEADGKLAEARAALPADCDHDACFAARVRIGKALMASLESALDDEAQARLYLAASIDASERSSPHCAYLDVIVRHVTPTPAHPTLVRVLQQAITALKVALPDDSSDGIRMAYATGVDAASSAQTCEEVGGYFMQIEGRMQALQGGDDGRADRRGDAFTYGFLREKLGQALTPAPAPVVSEPTKGKGKGKGKGKATAAPPPKPWPPVGAGCEQHLQCCAALEELIPSAMPCRITYEQAPDCAAARDRLANLIDGMGLDRPAICR